MSKTLEFIEQATIVNQRRLEQYKRDLESYEKDGGFINYGAKIFHLKNDITHIEEIVLPNLHQIKCELEAWEVVADKIFYGVGRCLIDSSVWFGEEAETIKKALEAKDEQVSKNNENNS